MVGFRELRAGLKVFSRHLRNARADPRRLLWVLTRTLRIVASGSAAGVLQRHAVVEDLYANYPEWIRRYDSPTADDKAAMTSRAALLSQKPLISVVLPCYNADAAHLLAAVDSVRQQLYPHWELCIADDASTLIEVRQSLLELARADTRIKVVLREHNGGISACMNSALELATGEFIAFLDQDDLLAEQALFRVAEAINRNPGAALLYSDEDKLDASDRRHSPHFKPDWNPEWARTTNYPLHLTVVARDAVHAVGTFDSELDGVQDWDLFLRVAEQAGDKGVVHVPGILYHWREGEGSTASGVNQKPGIESAQRRVIDSMLARRGIAATVERKLSGWWIRYQVPDPRPLVSIVIPTRDRGDLLAKCVDSLFERTAWVPFELILVDHGSTETLARNILDALAREKRATVIPFEGEFNYPAKCNLGVSRARGTVLVLMNNDVEVISPWWLDELVGHALQPETGLVAPLLLYPDDTIQHAGVILGVNGSADRPYLGYRQGYSGIAGRALSAQNVSALITACAAIRRDRYLEVGGMDESLAISHNDLDLCLRLQARGYRNVFTPHAELYHHESASRGYDNSPEQQRQADDEMQRFRKTWGHAAESDRYYNVNLTDHGQLFALAFPPRWPG